ncbi:MAG: ROK family protein [Clostridia bacterium]|nr:ROK family protein [Clostridia bacterium]
MYTIGIDLGGTNIAVGVVNEKYEIVARASRKTRTERSTDEILADMVGAAQDAVANAGLTMDQIDWVGVGSPGTINLDTGYIEYANNLHFEHVPLKAYMEEKLGRPCYINNDANVAAYGEYLAGSGKNAEPFVAVTLGTGVGGGVIIDGKIFSGCNFAGGELGHTVIVANGEHCSCGRFGCWEAYASATALIRQTKAAMNANPDSVMWKLCDGDENKASGRTAFDAMRAGDAAGKQVVDTYIAYIGEGLCNMVNIFQPEVLCIGGGICNEGETLMAPLRKQIEEIRYSKFSEKQTQLCRAELGNDAGIIGAAMLGKL